MEWLNIQYHLNLEAQQKSFLPSFSTAYYYIKNTKRQIRNSRVI